MQEQEFLDRLIDFITRSPTPFHATGNIGAMLHAAGFQMLDEGAAWSLDKNGRYCVTRNDSSIIAIQLGGEDPAATGLRMFGAHTDSPALKVKPQPTLHRNGFMQLGVEVYGGALLNPWFDRDLSIAGRVHFCGDRSQPQYRMIDFRRPVAIIPSLAIHLDREVNNQRSINAQQHLPPVLLLDEGKDNSFEALLLEQIHRQHPDAGAQTILGYDLYLYDTQPPALAGINNEFLCGARLDNLVSCFAVTQAVLSRPDRPAVMVCHDHEEVGSLSYCGADSDFYRSVLQRICAQPENYSRCVSRSLFVSCDNAHAIHPNYADRHDANHGPLLNQGPVIKVNSGMRYASNSASIAAFNAACRAAEVPVQHFVIRSDMQCGSTIGPITASQLGVNTVDVGVPQLAMHSIRETAGSRDAYLLYRALSAVL